MTFDDTFALRRKPDSPYAHSRTLTELSGPIARAARRLTSWQRGADWALGTPFDVRHRPKETEMSFPQQSRSNLAAAEANERRRELDKQPYADGSRHSGDRVSTQRNGVGGKFRAWLRRLMPR